MSQLLRDYLTLQGDFKPKRRRKPQGGRTDLEAPIPLGAEKAVEVAAFMRADTRLSYPCIAFIMREYHGVARAAGWWRKRISALGVPQNPAKKRNWRT